MGLRRPHNENEVFNTVGQSSGKLGHVDPMNKINNGDRGKWNHSSKRKRKKDLKEIKDILKLNHVRKLGEECENDGDSAVNSTHFTSNKGLYVHFEENNKKSNLKQSLTECSVKNNENTSSRKASEKQRRKGRDLVRGSENRLRKAEPSASSSTRIDNDALDDEENLEENAARMLSSRFDPSCTRFSSNRKASPPVLPSVNESSLLSPSGPSHINHGSNRVSGSESTSSGTMKRALWSRERHRQKGVSRKWKRYYEILSDDVDAYWILKHRIKVFWPMDQSWYYGLVRDYDSERKLHHIQYDDRDEEWIDLQKERFKLLLLPTELPVGMQQRNYVTLENHIRDVEANVQHINGGRRGSTVQNGSCDGNCMDSEPIISWMVRSSRRQVFSSLRMRKRKSSVVPLDSISAPSSEGADERHACSEDLSGNFDRYRLSSEDSDLPSMAVAMCNSPVPATATECCACSNNHMLLDNCKLPIVYYRRRFRQRNSARQAIGATAKASNIIIFPGVDMGISEEMDDDSIELLRLHLPWDGPRPFMINMTIPALSVLYCSLGAECTLWSRTVFLLQYGRLIIPWPRVYLEIQFFGNIAGPTCLLFEGCLKQAIHFTFLVLALLSQPNEQKKYSDLQFPVSPIRFRFSLLSSNQRKHLLFALSPPGEMKNLKWMNLEHEIKRYCSHTSEFFQLKCIYGSIKANEEEPDISTSSFYNNPISGKEQRQSCGQQRISLGDLSREPTYVNSNHPKSSCNLLADCSSGAKEDEFGENELIPSVKDAAPDSCSSNPECCPAIHNAGDSSRSPPIEMCSSSSKVETPMAEMASVPLHDGSAITGFSSPKRFDKTDQNAPASNPTARRSNWHRNRVGLMGSGSHINGWSDGRAEFLQNSFGDGPKKPRTHVSYGGLSSSGPGGTSHHQHKGTPHKQICTPSEKWGPERSLENASCDANVLIMDSDRGWRECGVLVVMESFDHTEWMLAVKQSGTTKYVYKAYHFLQPGSTNRFTHAMMWKGGKDWILEFPDRSQWSLFKKMYEECYKCNIRAASVRNIPIPGVRLIEESLDRWMVMSFVHNNTKYVRQVETDVEMALNPSRVLYDMDSDDEDWVMENRTSSEGDSSSSWEISEEFFEKMVDLFEKAAHSQNHEQFTSDEIEQMTTSFGNFEAAKKIHEYWKCKRQKKGMPLIRHFQPPLWEVYQQKVTEWELAMAKNKASIAGDRHGKLACTEKPPVFAFCLKPLGLEVPYKGSKHRSSQRRFSINNNMSNNCFSADNNGGFHSDGRRWNAVAYGDEKFSGNHNHEFLDSFSLHMVSSEAYAPQEVDDKYPMGDPQKLKKIKSKKLGTFLSPAETNRNRLFEKRSSVQWWNSGFYDHPLQRNLSDVYPRQESESLDGADHGGSKVQQDARSAAKRARLMVKIKRERAARLIYQADLAIHKATVALMTAEAIKAAASDRRDNAG